MNPIKVLNVYKWATMGGVERVFLNRAHAFQKNGLQVKYDVHFMHDSGGLARFENYLTKYNLRQSVNVVTKIDPKNYDIILSVDTPEILDYSCDYKKVFLECHTSYKENRSYIRKLPHNLGGVIVPSIFFESEIRAELPSYLKDRVFRLSNFVVNPSDDLEFNQLIYSKIPLFYLGRLDKLKNVEEIIRIYANYIRTIGDHFILILAGPIIEHEVDIYALIEKYNVLNRIVYFPPIDFENVNKMFRMIRLHKGIFLSSSTSETFGLSCAEAISNNIPILLSSITAHIDIVENNGRFLYKLGDVNEATEKLHDIYVNYTKYQRYLGPLSSKFSDKQFINEWNLFMEASKNEQ
ncbi:glycosyltransferase [Paenibacillus thiaminolyticus]|uniref:glycosyltransferase n=1 Tax=Paenibacillus thiaminolyticus TaxID=49283 RepID=UPI002542DE0C|nr:glycosyltransferase [Paenibacillus thiaminolyticus]WII37169.1 glycosyltransferase [Paenibacillus thiaminolyticus]